MGGAVCSLGGGREGSMLAGRICDLRSVSIWEKMCWDVLRIAESGWGGEEEQAWCCAKWQEVICARGPKVRLEEKVAACPRAADFLLKRTRVREGKIFQDVEASKRDFLT